jgi:hypothetical protein
MKHIITNPEWENAKFAQRLLLDGKPMSDGLDVHRFNNFPPNAVWLSGNNNDYFEWLKANAIPRFIEVDEP